MSDDIRWLSTKEASERLGVTLRTLYRFIDEGRLRYDGTPADLTRDGKPLDEHFHELTTSEA